MSRGIEKSSKPLGLANYSIWAHQLFLTFEKLWKTFVIFADPFYPWFRREAPSRPVALSMARRRERRTWRKHNSARFVIENSISSIHNGLLHYAGTSRQPWTGFSFFPGAAHSAYAESFPSESFAATETDGTDFHSWHHLVLSSTQETLLDEVSQLRRL